MDSENYGRYSSYVAISLGFVQGVDVIDITIIAFKIPEWLSTVVDNDDGESFGGSVHDASRVKVLEGRERTECGTRNE